jgi:hypothetical protein
MSPLSFAGAILLWAACALTARGSQSVSLAWDASPDTNVIGYFLYCEDTSNNDFRILNVTNKTTVAVSGLKEGLTYTFVVTAYDRDGLESDPSAEVTYIVPGSVQIGPCRNATDAVQVRFPVVSGHRYEIEASEDLNSWTRIGSTFGTSNEWVEFQDTEAAAFQKRFYRVVPR